MSAQARARDLARDERPDLDFFPTPPWAVRLILSQLAAPRVVLDPAAGDGAILRVVREAWPATETLGYDIDPARRYGNPARDALGSLEWDRADLYLGNPPYGKGRALAFAARAVCEAARWRATVAFLLRLDFMGSKGRAAFHRDSPCDVYVLAERPSYSKDGGNDMVPSAWFVWGPHCGGRWKVLT